MADRLVRCGTSAISAFGIACPWQRLRVHPLPMSASAELPSLGALAPPSDSDSLESTAQENELFRAAFERSGVGMAHLSTEGILLRVNAAFCEMTGYASAELTGMHFMQITLASDYGLADEDRRMRVATFGGSYTAERRYVRKNGEIFWVRLTTTMLADADGEAKYGMSVIEDITLRKSAEIRLQRLNHLHGVVGNISQGAAQAQDRDVLLALACRITVQRGGLRLALVADIDQASGALHSVAAREGEGGAALGGDLDAAIASTGTFADAVRAGRQSVCATATAPSEWQRLAGANGIGSTACFPLRAGGVPTGALIVAAAEADYFQADEIDLLTVVANCLSLTAESLAAERQRKHVQDEMRHQKFLLSSAAHVAGIGSWDLDVATGHLDGSDETMRMFGLDRATFGGTTSALLKIVHPDDKEMLRERFVSASSDVVELEYRIVRPDGEERVILDRGATTQIEGDRSLRRAGIVMDVTERRRADTQRLRHAERLTALVDAQRVLAHIVATVEQLFDRIPDLALGVVQADGAVFELIDGDSMVCVALTAAVAEQLGLRFDIAGSLSGEAIRLDRTIRCDDTETDPRVARTMCRKFGLRSIVATVVRDGNGPIGVLKLFGYGVAQFAAAESDSLELLAEAFGAAIQRKRAEEEIQRSLHIQRGIAGIQQEMISSSGDLQAMLDLMTKQALELTGATGAAILTIDGDDMVYRSASGSATAQRALRLPRASSLVGMSMDSNATLCCDDAQTDSRMNAAAVRDFGTRSMITTPLRAGGAVIGALIVFSGRASA
ncbi:MAG: GAF domain-containing protein, partial [Caldimonas sp.]